MLNTTVNIELLGEVNAYVGLAIKIGTALLLGGLVGLDREKKHKAAGIKTNILICLGSCLYTSVSWLNVEAHNLADPNRLAAQVVSGIGFLGAGAIIQGRGTVVGLTTAATIWVVAAIGVTIGSGYPVVATGFTLAILIVLTLLQPLYRMFGNVHHFQMEVLSHGPVKETIKQIIIRILGEYQRMEEEVIEGKRNIRVLFVDINAHTKDLPKLRTAVENIVQVQKVNFHESDEILPVEKGSE